MSVNILRRYNMAAVPKIKVALKLIVFIAILYLFIYNPIFTFLGIGSAKLIIALLIIYSLLNKRIFKFLIYFKIELFFIMLLFCYSLVTSFRANDVLFTQAYLFLIWFIESIFAPIVLIILFRNEFKKYSWDNIALAIGTSASVFTLILISSPEINEYVKFSLIHSSTTVAINDQFVRGFGFAEGLHGSYAMTQGLIFGICLRLIKEKWWYCLLILPIFISIAFNARTGLIAIPISLLILFLTYNFSYRITIFFIVLFLLFYNLDFSSIYFDNDIYKYEVTFDWIYKGFYDFIDILNGESSSNFRQTLLIDEAFFPSNTFEFIFGTGNFSADFNRVDNGYYYLLWFGGWLIVLIVFFLFIYMFSRIHIIQQDNYYTYLFFILLLIYSVKSNYLFNPSGISRLIGIYYVYSILNHKIKYKYLT